MRLLYIILYLLISMIFISPYFELAFSLSKEEKFIEAIWYFIQGSYYSLASMLIYIFIFLCSILYEIEDNRQDNE